MSHLNQMSLNGKSHLPSKSLLDLLEYVWSHPKRNKAFTGTWTYCDVLHTLVSAGFTSSLRYTVATDGRIDGLVIFEAVSTNGVCTNEIYVRQILSDSKKSLRTFLDALREAYPTVVLRANRRGNKQITYTEKAKELLYGR